MNDMLEIAAVTLLHEMYKLVEGLNNELDTFEGLGEAEEHF